MICSIIEFVAHFHPLLVHLPIGILLAGLLLQGLATYPKYAPVKPAIPVILLCGAISALLSCITGYLLSISDDYDEKLVGWHQWMGITVALTSFMLYAKERNPQFAVPKKLLSFGLLVLIMVTGHLGGSLTHGSDYLTKPLSGSSVKDSSHVKVIPPLADVENAFAFNDIIKPIFQTKCYSCHGPNKQKGKLRMDDVAALMKGGKDGKVIEPGNADGSEMIKRVLLPVDNEDHMPPKEKPQLTESQVALIHWWISQQADFTKKVKDLQQPEKVKPLLLALQQPEEKKDVSSSIPALPVEKANVKTIDQLKEKGIVVLPVAQNSNYLLANFVTDSIVNTNDLKLLASLKKQLIWLKLGFTNLADSQLVIIGQLENLTRLGLEHTLISDKGLSSLQSLQKLQYLNLVGTSVTATGVLSLQKTKSLKSLFLYQANVRPGDWPNLKKAFPNTQIDSGGYTVPTLPTDTMEVKAKKEY